MDTGDNPGDGIASAPSACGSGTVNYPGSVQVCNGQMVTTVDDAGMVTSLAAYPRQPFDFAGRTGTITFDVSNDSQGSHAAWPELWVTDQPVPDPFTHEGTWLSQPRNGFGIRFAGCSAGTCVPDGNNGVGVDSAVVATNYRVNDSFYGGSLNVTNYQDVIKSAPGQMNHYQVRVSATQIQVYGTNPFTPGSAYPPLRHVATISNFGTLGFTRGLVWLEDVHYNGNKFNTQGTHSFHWDNLGFDGPVLARDLGFDVPNNHQADSSINSTGAPGFDNGYLVPLLGSLKLTIPDVSGIASAKGALIEFDFYSFQVIPLQLAINGHSISIPWPYPNLLAYTPRTVAIPVPLSDLVRGNNTLTFPAAILMEQIQNVDLILQGAGGIVSP